MKSFRKTILLTFIPILILSTFSLPVWASEESNNTDPVEHEWNMADLFIIRPIGFIAGVAGTGLFVVSLPFTIPAGGVNDAADMFIVQPFKFAFTREFPDNSY